MKILNLTQHQATPEQQQSGVFDCDNRELLSKLLTFTRQPDHALIKSKARALVVFAQMHGAKKVMIGGAPYLMSLLEAELIREGIQPLYAYSERVSEDQVQPDGSVRKVNVFRHLGFIEAYRP